LMDYSHLFSHTQMVAYITFRASESQIKALHQ